MDDTLRTINTILAIIGGLFLIIGIFGGPTLYVWIKKKFPERTEIITKEMLDHEIEKLKIEREEKIKAMSYDLRDAMQREFASMSISITSQFESLKSLLEEREKRYDERHEHLKREIERGKGDC